MNQRPEIPEPTTPGIPGGKDDGVPRIRKLRRFSSRWTSVLVVASLLAASFFMLGSDRFEELPAYTATCLALMVAAYQHDQARRMKKRLTELLESIADRSATQTKELHRSLTAITESISTQYVGEFPHHLPKITALLAKATRSVEILSDVPGYGHYSSPQQYFSYRNTIQQLAVTQNVNIRMAFYTQDLAKKAAVDAFGDDFSAICKTEAFRTYKKTNTKDIGSIDDFYKLIIELDYLNCKRDFEDMAGIEVIWIKEPVQIYFWIVDGLEAVFSIATSGLDPVEVAFTTTDANFITILQALIKEA